MAQVALFSVINWPCFQLTKTLGKAATALGIWATVTGFLVGTVLLNIYWLERVTLPSLCKRMSEDSQPQDEGS